MLCNICSKAKRFLQQDVRVLVLAMRRQETRVARVRFALLDAQWKP